MTFLELLAVISEFKHTREERRVAAFKEKIRIQYGPTAVLIFRAALMTHLDGRAFIPEHYNSFTIAALISKSKAW